MTDIIHFLAILVRKMRIHYIIHAEFEKLGAIRGWAETNRHQLHETNSLKGEPPPKQTDFDCLIILGGPQSAMEIGKYPYLQEEIRFIQHTIKQDIPVLGICLGAQLIGVAEGAPVEKSPKPEIGHYPIHMTPLAKQDKNLHVFPDTLSAMHWHAEMPGLTPNAVVLAKSAGCPRQIIRYKHNVYGFQCHLELTQPDTQAIIDSYQDQHAPGPFIQPTEQILGADFATPNGYMNAFLDRLLTDN